MQLPDLEVLQYPHDKNLRVDSLASDLNTDDNGEFLRPVLSVFNKPLRESHDNDLVALLKSVDAYFTAQAAAICAEVVPHQWVLIDGCDVRTSTKTYGTPKGLNVFGLEGLWLGAKVKRVEGLPIVSASGFHRADIDRLKFKLEGERSLLHEALGWSIMELARPRQYLAATDGLCRPTAPITLVDIDILT
jgi:hypothetical protein